MIVLLDEVILYVLPCLIIIFLKRTEKCLHCLKEIEVHALRAHLERCNKRYELNTILPQHTHCFMQHMYKEYNKGSETES